MQGQSSIQAYYDKEWLKLLSWFEGEQPKPSDENLLKSCAWLAALVHRRIDQAPYTVHAQLLEQHYPFLIQDIPAYGMVAYERQGARSGDIARGDVLKTAPEKAGHRGVHFQTTAPLQVLDMNLTACRMISAHELELTFSVPASMAGQSLGMLPLYWDAPFDKACMSYYMLNQQLRAAYASQENSRVSLVCESAPMTYQNSLSDRAGADYQAHQYLADYFVYPQKYMMVALYPLDARPWILQAGSLTLHLVFQRDFPLYAMPALNDIKLNAVPICNRFEQYCEPIRCDRQEVPYSITVDHSDCAAAQIIRLKSVHGRVHQTGETITYRAACGHSLFQEPYYLTEGKTLTCHAGPLVAQTLSLLAMVCQGHIPHDSVGVEPLYRRAGAAMAVRSLHRPTRLINRPSRLSADLLYNHMLITTEDLSSVSSLIAMLKLMNRSSDPASERRIEGIVSMGISSGWGVRRGSVMQERVIAMTFNDNHFSGCHDAYLFGTVLHIFFTYMYAVHESVSMVVTLTPSMEVLRWKPLRRANILI